MKLISIIGSTGSIGESALSVIREHPKHFRVVALAANKNIERLKFQIREFKPRVVCVYDRDSASGLIRAIGRRSVKIVTGDEGLSEVAALPELHTVLCGIVGAKGIDPILAAIAAGKDVGIANKEPLVMAGDLIMARARTRGVHILPIDSEHSAIWQCLESTNGNLPSVIKKLILTASGGPFLGRHRSELTRVTPMAAIKHPRWKMGKKISVDSATLMNKGLEIKEAHHLFGVPVKCIEILIHPEAVVHSMVEFIDGSHIAQLAINDMRLPIQYALSYPHRLPSRLPSLDFVRIKQLTFQSPDRKNFPCLDLACTAWQAGGTAPAVLNAANEVAVSRFLRRDLSFLSIPRLIERVMSRHRLISNPGLKEILNADEWSREEAAQL